MTLKPPRGLASAAFAALALAACGSATSTGPSATPDPLGGSITVFAASSLTSAFNTAERGLELDHPGFTAKYSYAGSQSLVTQIISGAPADVIATANTTTMQQLSSPRGSSTLRKSSVRTSWRSSSPRVTRRASRPWPTSPTPASPWCWGTRACRWARTPRTC